MCVCLADSFSRSLREGQLSGDIEGFLLLEVVFHHWLWWEGQDLFGSSSEILGDWQSLEGSSVWSAPNCPWIEGMKAVPPWGGNEENEENEDFQKSAGNERKEDGDACSVLCSPSATEQLILSTAGDPPPSPLTTLTAWQTRQVIFFLNINFLSEASRVTGEHHEVQTFYLEGFLQFLWVFSWERIQVSPKVV